jgi:asparagine synthetase A
LNLELVVAPIIVRAKKGINDDLDGIKQPVRFYVKEADITGEVVHVSEVSEILLEIRLRFYWRSMSTL